MTNSMQGDQSTRVIDVDARLDALADSSTNEEEQQGLESLIEELVDAAGLESIPTAYADRMEALAECDSDDEHIDGLVEIVRELQSHVNEAQASDPLERHSKSNDVAFK